MQTNNFKAILKRAARVLAILPFAAVVAFGQQTVNLTVAPTTTTLPDGTTVPMWGYFCGAAVTSSTAGCAALNQKAPTGTWSPVLITVPTGQALTINLTNNLSFTPAGATSPNLIPTSIIIAGQVGGGLGGGGNYVASPSHIDAQACVTWFIASSTTPPGTPCTVAAPTTMPPNQGPRVQSFGTEVAAGTTASLTWTTLAPGTYLLESGTHPSIQVPMGLIGMLVVTTAPAGTTAGTAYPGVTTTVAATTVPPVTYNAELPLEFSEIDPVQNKAVNTAVNTPGFSEMNMKTFGDSVGSITVTNGGSGYTSNPAVTIGSAGTGTGAATATATAAVGAVISGISVTNPGTGYTSVPAVTITDTGTPFTAASATANMAVGAVTAPPAGTGSGYVVNDLVSFTGGGGAGASGRVATVTAAGAITALTLTNGGLDYTSVPTAVVGGTGATLTPVLTSGAVSSVTVTAGGSGYVVGDIVTFTGTSTTAATGTVGTVSATGAILTVTVTNGGSGYTAVPTATAGGTGASLTVTLVVGSVTVTNSGSGYTAPTVAIAAPTTGTTATAAATIAGTHGVVYSVSITNSGSRYSAPPSVTIAAGTTTATAVASLSQSCVASSGAATGCYPSAVNYTPFYYLIDGVAFNKTQANLSMFAATAGVGTTGPVTTGITGTVLLRLVNAGLRMHVPSTIGSQTTGFTGTGALTTSTNPVSGFTLIAEDGNVVPGVQLAGATTVPSAPKVQTDVFMAASKTFDVMINVPAAGAAALPIYDRELSLSGNSSTRDAGMLAYISVNGSVASGYNATGPQTGVFAAAVARADTYSALAAGQVFRVTDVSKGVIANDTNVYGVTLLAAPASGTLTCEAQPQNTVGGLCANGTFTYTPNGTATSDTFTYCANGSVTAAVCSSGLTATVTLGASNLTGNPTAVAQTYNAVSSSFIRIPSPGLLIGNSDPSGLPLGVVTSTAPTISGGTVVLDAQGGFTASLSPAPTTATVANFNYTVQNSQGRMSASGTVTVNFPAPSNLTVNVVDAQAYQNCQGNSTCISNLISSSAIKDYRWIIEEDRTFWVDPNCTTNTGTTTPPAGCPNLVGPSGQSTIPTYGVNFHTSAMPFVAQGCTGVLSCEGGQTMLDSRATITIGTGAVLTPVLSTTGTVASVTVTTPGSGYAAGDIVAFSAAPTGGTTATGTVGTVNTTGAILTVNITNPGSGYATAPTASVSNTNPTSGQHIPAVCDLGNGACRPDPNCAALPCTAGGFTPTLPSSVHLDPSKRYYISVLPGDAANPFPSNLSAPTNCLAGEFLSPGVLNTGCGHTMSGAPVPPACNVLLSGCNATNTTAAFAPVTVLVLPTPLPTGKLSVMVFEDDFPLNGEMDAGGGVDILSPNEPGLGGFNIVLWDTYGGLGDVTGQNGYDMFNQPLSNALSGVIDPSTGLDACPISTQGTQNPVQTGITGMIVTCPKYEADNTTLSPLAGQALIANLMPEKFSVQAYPGADRIARGEEWLQTNTLDGQHPHDSFIRIGEPGYFQEYGPAGYHVTIGFANPAIINARHDAVCAGAFGTVNSCSATVKGQVDLQRQSRTPDQRLYSSESRDGFNWTQCWVSLGDPDAEDFMFTKCDADGNFQFNNVPDGNWRVTIGDQWNDQIIDGLSTPVNLASGQTKDLGHIGVQQWQSNLYTRLFIDDNKNGIPDPGEIGIPLLYTKIRYRDGHNSNSLTTDFNGVANFNETFPLFNWYVVETDSTRYKRTGTHVVYDAGGPADGSGICLTPGVRPCGSSTAYQHLANTYESLPLPADLHVPGAVYCAAADCATEAAAFAAGTANTSAVTNSTGRIDPPWVAEEGWSGMTSQSNWIEFGMAPYAACNSALPVSATNFCVSVPNLLYNPTAGGTTASTIPVGENGGIHGIVDYSATRPFDTAEQMIEQPWEPYVPGVTINLYQEGFAADGSTPTLTMVDTTTTSSWDAWAQGFYPNSTAGSGSTAGQKPYMSCPGQGTATGTNADLFYYTLFDQPNYLNYYNSLHGGPALSTTTVPYNSQYKCYDAMHIWNQIQPAPYDGRYEFPSSLGINPTNGKLLAVKGSTNGVASSMNGTNCTICVQNPDTTDVYRVGNPMLPPGKYVVEVIMPPGYEVYKEEDKNLLIGDNYIAPVTQQFAGLGGQIFIIPDQASIASMYDAAPNGYNPNNFQNPTTALGLGAELSGVPGFPGYQNPLWPCVGEMRVVPDYLSLFPLAAEVAPFAGATRPLCDRKEVTLADQMNIRNNFFIYTSTHIASKFTGVITDDFTSEFDPFAPQFGEKFAPPNMPVSTKDYLGNEISRVYSDHFGLYDGLTFSSWEVNPPNITGYSPTMMVQCMNDAGPILDTRAQVPNPANPSQLINNPTFGQMIPDPLYNPAYSQFCYEEPYMPGLTTYLDTPVVPTQAFAGAGYNNADCAYPDATPAISEVDGDGIGPYVSAAGHTLTIYALGDQQVPDAAYSGPSASAAPFNAKTVHRHYGFGANKGTVTIGGITVPAASITTWNDNQIILTVPSGVPLCPIQQQAQYGGPGTTTAPNAARCGQLVVTTAAPVGITAKQSVDAVTVTIGGKAPIHIPASGSVQSAIDQALPGDLIIVDPTTRAGCVTTSTAGVVTSAACTTTGATVGFSPSSHTELLIVWKPVRLQGVGAASSILNANTHPAGKLLDPWRRHIDCLFGLTLQGVPIDALHPYDPNFTFNCPDNQTNDSWNHFVGTGTSPQIDRLPLEATVGWTASLSGNLAELLQEPTLMGAYEGAGITVLAKGLEFHGQYPWNDGTEAGAFPTQTTLLTGVVSNPGGVPGTAGALVVGDANPLCHTYSNTGSLTTGTPTLVSPTNPYPSSFICNPSSIDGLSVTNSSQGGGGIFVHGWAHLLQIANNRVYNNAGSLSGGISVGQGEFALPYIVGGATNAAPGSCSNGTGLVTNQHEPFCLQLMVNVHNNMITDNSSLGDELFSATLSGGGGATFCTGNDYYKFNYNWVCGNISTGEGGGLVHLGEIYNGDIEHNSIVFNQSHNPTIPTNGGGIMVEGTPDTDPVCPGVPDSDCPTGLSDGTGPGLVINANLIQGNSADDGSGGGIRLQQVNGTEVGTFASQPQYWHDVTISNNIIVNNIAGWDGAGISLQDSLNVNIVNNTIMHNDSTAISGVLTQSLGTPQASAPPGNCVQTGNTASCPQSAGVTSTPNSSLLTTAFGTLAVTCPTGHPNCTGFSNPILLGDVISQNRAFNVTVGGLGPGNQNQQNVVSMSPALNQVSTGQCVGGGSYWDIGVRGDTGAGNHGSGFTLNPLYSILSSGSYSGTGNSTSDPAVVRSYCNGSRVPPECTTAMGCGGPNGFGVPPGIADAVTPNPLFSLVPAATVDEGNNWISLSWGPLSLVCSSTSCGSTAAGVMLGNYSITGTSPAINGITCSGTSGACTVSNPALPANYALPRTDFFNNPRPDAAARAADIGAVELAGH